MNAPADLAGPAPADLYRELAKTGLPRRLFELARDEDLAAAGDITAQACMSPSATMAASLVARQDAVLCGLACVDDLIEVFASRVAPVPTPCSDGDAVERGDIVLRLEGNARDLLALERTMLNIIGRLSGVATLTALYKRTMLAGLASGQRAPVLTDTRKTTPGWRVLEKYAVVCGGGVSHRLGLHDAVLIKDNHLAHVPTEDIAVFVRDAATSARAANAPRFVMVEVDSLEQLRGLLTLDAGVIDYVLLDNMPPDRLREAVVMRDDARAPIKLEASGGANLDTIGAIAATGVDRIAVGALTHQATSCDFALDADT